MASKQTQKYQALSGSTSYKQKKTLPRKKTLKRK